MEQMTSYSTLLERLNILKGESVANKRILTLERGKLDAALAMKKTLDDDLIDYAASITLCRACMDEQADAKAHVENIATSLLNGVMRGVAELYSPDANGALPEYAFVLEPVEDKDTEAIVGLKPLIVKNGIADDPKSFGGGVQTLVSFAIRLIYVLLNPGISQVLILDEPMTNLSPKAWRFVVKFMEDIQRDLDLQVIAITHSGAQFPNTWIVYREGDTSYAKFDNRD